MSYPGIIKNGIAGDQSAPAKPATFPALSRQPSIYSQTFDEFQITKGGIGKDLGSMNMDEFLKNLWSAEESKAMATALGDLQRQRSLTFPRTLSTISQKTVDEVWRNVITDNVESVGESNLQKQQRQATIGEMTLEEFLVRAGAVREENYEYKKSNSNSAVGFGFPQVESSNAGVMPKSNSGNSGTNFGLAGVRKQQGMRGGVNGLMSGMVGFGAGSVAVGSDRFGKGDRGISALPPVPYAFNGVVRGRKSDGAFEKVFERRQRRMIKNRESAARSRARKQAYTMELEAELAMLKEENQELEKKHTEVLEVQKKQIIELLNRRLRPKRSCLRRTHTGPW